MPEYVIVRDETCIHEIVIEFARPIVPEDAAILAGMFEDIVKSQYPEIEVDEVKCRTWRDTLTAYDGG